MANIYGIPRGIWRYIDRTSEKTIETNYLSEMSKKLSSHFLVTIIGPSRVKESDVGFDAMMTGLPKGNVLVLQFKSPFPRRDRFARFTLNVPQLQTLLDRFRQGEAFYVLSPFTRTFDFITAHRRGDFLRETRLMDVHDIPYGRKTSKKTRTIKYRSYNDIEVTDPAKYVKVERTWSFDEIVSSVMEEQVGKRVPAEREIERPYEKKGRQYGGPNYYVHVSRRML